MTTRQSIRRLTVRPRRIVAVLAVAALPMLPVSPAAAQESGLDVYGSTCAACHQPDGTGIAGAVPPLAGNPRVADTDYVGSVIREGLGGPIEVNGLTYDGTMPAFPDLSDGEIAAVIGYVQAGLPHGDASGGAADPAPGRALFLGEVGFTHGGPACSACHAAGSAGDLSALPATLGSDLTGVAFGRAEMLSAVQGHEMSMAAASYATDTLTPEEVGAVAAFLASTEEEAAPMGDAVVLAAVGILILLVTATAMAAADRSSGGAP